MYIYMKKIRHKNNLELMSMYNNINMYVWTYKYIYYHKNMYIYIDTCRYRFLIQ